MARLAIARDFLAEYAKLEKSVQSAVEAAISKFAAHTHAGLYLEKLQHSRDGRIRTIRVDSMWRGVVLAPESGDTYCLITVLPHDKANAYATSHRFSVNQALGVLEVRDEETLQKLQPSLRAAHPARRSLPPGPPRAPHPQPARPRTLEIKPHQGQGADTPRAWPAAASPAQPGHRQSQPARPRRRPRPASQRLLIEAADELPPTHHWRSAVTLNTTAGTAALFNDALASGNPMAAQLLRQPDQAEREEPEPEP